MPLFKEFCKFISKVFKLSQKYAILYKYIKPEYKEYL